MYESIIRDEMERLDKISGLDTSNVPIRISSKMTRTWGECRYTRIKNKRYILELVFAKRLMEHGTHEHIVNTVRHEYAHLYVIMKYNKDHGHDAVWKKTAIWLGCSGNRCESFEEISDFDNGIKYRVACLGCGEIFKYRRKSNIVKELEVNPDSDMFTCQICKGKNFVMEIVSK